MTFTNSICRKKFDKKNEKYNLYLVDQLSTVLVFNNQNSSPKIRISSTNQISSQAFEQGVFIANLLWKNNEYNCYLVEHNEFYKHFKIDFFFKP